jgi:hypothetical protein
MKLKDSAASEGTHPNDYIVTWSEGAVLAGRAWLEDSCTGLARNALGSVGRCWDSTPILSQLRNLNSDPAADSSSSMMLQRQCAEGGRFRSWLQGNCCSDLPAKPRLVFQVD